MPDDDDLADVDINDVTDDENGRGIPGQQLDDQDDEVSDYKDESDGQDEIKLELDEPEPDEPKHTGSLPNNLRKLLREEKKKSRALEAKLNSFSPEKQKSEPKEPELVDFGYDETEFKKAHKDWLRGALKREEDEQKLVREQEEAKKAWEGTIDAYKKQAANLKVPDFADSEETVYETLSEAQQGVLLDAVKNPAAMVYALGRSHKSLSELAKIKNLVKFAAALAVLEAQKLRVTTSPETPGPERKISSATGGAVSSKANYDRELAKLEAEAEKTGDRTKIRLFRQKWAQKNGAR